MRARVIRRARDEEEEEKEGAKKSIEKRRVGIRTQP